MANNKYQICTRCIMDTSDTQIVFDKDGICNHCSQYDAGLAEHVFTGDKGNAKFNEWIDKIKKSKKPSQKYDCIFGVSGGVDSTYLAYLLKEKGLNPLAVHFDYGWNSEIAVHNINSIVKKLGIDLYTYVIDWEVIKDLQYSYLKASVLDIDVPADQLIFASLYDVCKQHKLKYVVSGNNYTTESLLPQTWYFARKFDLENLKDIHRQFGRVKKIKYPKLGKWQLLKYKLINDIQFTTPLNWIDYNKPKVIEFIKKELDWKDYGGKHYESIFTRFYQGYILLKKFKIDKRRAHLSNLVVANQMERSDAMLEISNNDYLDNLAEQDKIFFIKKLGISEEEFNEIMAQKPVSHFNFKIENSVYSDYPILKPFKFFGNFIKSKLN